LVWFGLIFYLEYYYNTNYSKRSVTEVERDPVCLG